MECINKETLGRIYRITDGVMKIKGVASRDVNSLPTITDVTAKKGALKGCTTYDRGSTNR